MKQLLWTIVALLALGSGLARADDAPKVDPAAPATTKYVDDAIATAQMNGDTAWMLVASGLVLLMVPGLALFYGGMVRKKNVLATLMQSMAPLAIVGVYWIAIGYCLAFGTSIDGWIGWNEKLIFLKGIGPDTMLPGTNIPVYVHVMFQGMFAIITPALISGAVAERIRFGPYLLFLLVWVTFVYCPLAHWVWAMNWWDGDGKTVVGLLGRSPENGGLGAIDFAGGTVVHIAAGTAGLAAILVLRKRLGFPDRVTQPNSMVLTVLGAGLLWFGWFGFNGGSALGANFQAVAAFSASQAAAAAAGLSWMLAEWCHKGKPTGLGLASGIVAGLVAVTPASGFVYIWGGLAIGLIAGFVCYGSVLMKGIFGYDDSLDAFGVHGVGGFLGAVLTGVFCYVGVNSAGSDGLLASGKVGQVVAQFEAAAISAVFSFVVSLILVKAIDLTIGFTTDVKSETLGLDITEHGEVGFDFGPEIEGGGHHEPRPSIAPPSALSRYSIVVDNVTPESVAKAWTAICANNTPMSPEFKAIYPNFTTVQGNRFRFRGGDSSAMRDKLTTLLKSHLQNAAGLRAYVEA
jgi:ammonium transporter